MAQAQKQLRYTPEEYLAIECDAPTKSEYVNGEIFAMACASLVHTIIAGNVAGELRQQLKGRPCTTHSNDMRVKVGPTGMYTYPDVVVVCGAAKLEDGKADTLLNPTVIVEVLSQSTEAYDRGAKFAHYRRLESLREYLLVAQDAVHVEHYVRQADGRWLLSEANRLDDAIHLLAIDCRLAIAEVYDKTGIQTNIQTDIQAESK